MMRLFFEFELLLAPLGKKLFFLSLKMEAAQFSIWKPNWHKFLGDLLAVREQLFLRWIEDANYVPQWKIVAIITSGLWLVHIWGGWECHIYMLLIP